MADEEDDDATGSDMVPRARLNREIAKRKAAQVSLEEARAELRTSQAEVARLKPLADGHETLTDQLAETRAALAAEQAGRKEDAALVSLVTDPELARFEYERATRGDDKRPDLATWLTSQAKDPAKAPGSLGSVLIKSEESDGGDGAGDSSGKSGGNGGTKRRTGAGAEDDVPPSSGRAPDASALTAAAEEAKRTGDWGPYRKLRGLPDDTI